MTYAAAGMKGIDELKYRYRDDETEMEYAMRALHPFMKAVTDGPWVKEYLDFITKVNQKVQYGDATGLGELMASLTLSPMKPPKWVAGLLDYDPHVKTTEGFVNKIRTDWADDVEAYGHRRNMFGRKILPLERFGPGSEFEWFGGEKEITDFLRIINYDKHYPSNAARVISGQGNGANGVEQGADAIKMTPKMQDAFEMYTGESRVGPGGRTMAEDLKRIMNDPGIYDPKTQTLKARELIVRTAVLKLHEERHAMARKLVQFNPAFRVREKQIEIFHKRYLENGGRKVDADKIREAQINEMNKIRQSLKGKF
jgi:hypothetical protein